MTSAKREPSQGLTGMQQQCISSPQALELQTWGNPSLNLRRVCSFESSVVNRDNEMRWWIWNHARTWLTIQRTAAQTLYHSELKLRGMSTIHSGCISCFAQNSCAFSEVLGISVSESGYCFGWNMSTIPAKEGLAKIWMYCMVCIICQGIVSFLRASAESQE